MDDTFIRSKSQARRIAAQRGIAVCQKCYGACGITDGQTGEYRQCPECRGEGVEDSANQGRREGSGMEGSGIPKSGCGCN